MKTRTRITTILLIVASFFAMGAATPPVVPLDDVAFLGMNYVQEIYRDMNNQTMITTPGSTGWWYIQGRIDARTEDFWQLYALYQANGGK